MNRREFLNSMQLIGLGALLAACGAPAIPAPADLGATAPAPQPLTLPPTATQAKTILFWYNAENHKPEYEARVAEISKKFNIDFRLELLTGELENSKLQAALSAGKSIPDIAEMNADEMVKLLKGDDASIPFAALNNILNTSTYYAQVLRSRWDRYTKDRNIYGAPHDVHPMVLLYNDRAWQHFGVDLSTVATWDDFLSACYKVEPNMPGGGRRYAFMDVPVYMAIGPRLLEKGLWWTDKNNEPMLNDPRFRLVVEDALRFKDYRANQDWQNHVSMLKSGQVMAQIVPDWLYGIHKQENAKDQAFMANSPMRITRIPGFTKDDPRVGTWGGTAGTVLKMSPNQDLAIEVLLYLYFDNSHGQLETRYRNLGLLPPVKSIWGDAAFHQPDPYVGGQITGDVFIPAAEALPSYSDNWTTLLVSATWNVQEQPMWSGIVSVDDAIRSADAIAREQIRKST